MTIAQIAPAMIARLVALAAARLARAQSVLRRRRGGDGDPRAGAAGVGPQRIRARRAHGRHLAAGRRRPAARPDQRPTARAIEDTQTKYRTAQDVIRATLRQEPFDAAAMRAAMAKTRAARQNFDQVIQGVFAGTAAQMSSAGRHALADWPPGRKIRNRNIQQSFRLISLPEPCSNSVFELSVCVAVAR